MRLRSYQTWKLQYLFVSPEQWARDHETHFWLKQYEVLDVHAATLVLRDVAQRDPAFLAALVGQTFGARGFDKQRTLLDLIQGLGRQRLGDKGLPRFAWLFVARRKRERVAAPVIDPWKEVREAIQAAEQAPRGYVAVQAVNDAGTPVSNLRLELLLADGQVRSAYTDHEGSARAEPIPQGQCHIRVAELDGSCWHAEKGPSSQRVDRGRKRRHVVEQGECLSRIAHRYGIKDWKKVWNAPENEALRKKRKNPNVLLPGDEITVPGIDVHEIIVPTDQTHRIVVTNPTMSVEVGFRDSDRNSMGEVSYVVSYSENGKETQKQGQLDANGRLQLLVHVSVRHIHVRFPDLGCAFELQVGALDPLENADNQELIVSGLQARLAALGYGACDAPGAFGDGTKQALQAFQQSEMAEEACTGEADSATRSKLVAVYGV